MKRACAIGFLIALAWANTALVASAGGVAELTQSVSSTDPAARLKAIQALAELGSNASPATAALIKALAMPHEDTRLNAAIALGKIGKSAVPELQTALGSADSDVRFYAVWALGWIGPEGKAAAPEVIKLLADANDGVRRKAAYTLGRIAPDPETAVRELVKALRDANAEVRSAAADSLAKFGAAATPALIEALSADKEFVRIQAMASLKSIGAAAKDAVAPLRDIYLKGENNISFPASETLAAIGKPAMPALLEGLKSERVDVRVNGVRALAKVGPDAVPDLVDALGSPQADVRREAAQQLGSMNIADKMVVLGLAHAVADRDHTVKVTALNALHRLGAGAKLAAPKVVLALFDEDQQVRQQALYTIGNIRAEPDDVLPSLAKLMQDPNNKMRPVIARTLPAYGPKAMPILLEALKDDDASVRQAALFGISNTPGELGKALPAVAALLKDPNHGISVRMSAATALSRGGQGAVPHLMEALKAPEYQLRSAAINSLRQLGPVAKKALKEVHQIALTDPNLTVRRNAAGAVIAMGEEAIPAAIELLGKTNDMSARLQLVLGLGNLGPKAKDAVSAMIPLVQDKNLNVRSRVITALGNIGPDAKEAIPALEKAAMDGNMQISSIAKQSLEKIRAK